MIDSGSRIKMDEILKSYYNAKISKGHHGLKQIASVMPLLHYLTIPEHNCTSSEARPGYGIVAI